MQVPTQIVHAPDSVVVALRAQLELQRAFQSDLLATVYWSLGVVVLIVVVLVGFGWFANFRVYQRDLEALRRELESLVTTAIANATARMQDRLTTSVDQARKELEAAGSTRIDRLARDLLILKCDSLQLEHGRSMERKSFGIAASYALRLLESAVSLGFDIYINIALKALVDSLAQGGALTTRELTQATDLLVRVPDSFAVLRERARDAIGKAATI
jgi:hypothetical protein